MKSQSLIYSVFKKFRDIWDSLYFDKTVAFGKMFMTRGIWITIYTNKKKGIFKSNILSIIVQVGYCILENYIWL